MPIYEYLCVKCEKEFELSMSVVEFERRKEISCPECRSSNVVRVISGFHVQTSKKS